MKSTFRIAIDGAQSTGKTTLLEALTRPLGAQFYCIPEAARIIAPRFGIHRATDWPKIIHNQQALLDFFAAEEEWQIGEQASSGRFIIDSSLLLTAAYRAAFGVGNERHCKFVYDLIVFCPTAALPWIYDSFRVETKRREVEDEYLSLLGKYHRGAILALDENSGRYERVLSAINTLLES